MIKSEIQTKVFAISFQTAEADSVVNPPNTES
jgi:hypothetical protein